MSNETPAVEPTPEELGELTADEHYAAAMRYMAHAAPARLHSPRQAGASLGAISHLLAALALRAADQGKARK